MLQILHLNALHPLAFVSLEKDVSWVSLYGFCGLITWLTKYMVMTTESEDNLQKKKHGQKLKPGHKGIPRYDG